MTDELKVVDGQVVSIDYVLHVDGEVLDASEEGEPLEFIQGEGQIIPGLETALYGMVVGESKSVTVSAEEGYGEVDKEAYMDVPRDQFPASIGLEVGLELQVRDPSGGSMQARIDKVEEKSVRLDFNHPLAGKTLDFDVKIVGLRDATEEEMAHGHVHGEDYDEDDYDEDFDDDDLFEDDEDESFEDDGKK